MVSVGGVIMSEEEYEKKYNSLNRIAELAEKYGFEVIEGETAFNTDFICEIMNKMDDVIEHEKCGKICKKVYVSTSGCYSDYRIDRVFSTREKAQEYSKWREDANEIEEYEVDNIEFEKWHHYHATFRYFSEVGGEKYEFTWYNKDYKWDNGVFFQIKKLDVVGECYEITIDRWVSDNNFNQELYEKKFQKVAYDTLAQIKSLMQEGFSEYDIREMLKNTESE